QAPAPRPTPIATATRPPKLENPTPANPRQATQPTEVTQVTPEPVIRGAPVTEPASTPASDSGKTEHRGFLSRVFHGAPKTNSTVVTGGQPMTQSVAPMPEPKPES